MTSRQFSSLLFVGALALAACGGSDDSSSEGDAPSGESPSGDVTTEPDTTESESEGDGPETGDTDTDGSEGGDAASGAAGAAPLTAAWSVPVNGSAGGSTIAISPDGSQVAFMTGGIQPMIQIHDGATGAVVNSAEYHGQGLELVWTTDNQLVSWDSERLHRVDATTLAYPGAVELTVAPGAEECPTSVFRVEFDRASNAMFISDFHDTGAIVCRLDIGAATITSTIIEGQGGANNAFLRPETGELVVTYSVESLSGTDSVAVLDATTLEVKSSGPTSTGEPVLAATATDLVLSIDRSTDSLASTGQAIAAQTTGDRFGSYLFGSSEGALVVMDAATGAALFSGSDGFRPLDATDDGSKVVVLLQDSVELYTLS